MSDSNSCSCGSSLGLSQCCLPIIQGKKKAGSAEELLRARYTAFTLGEVDFILTSHHSQTRDQVKREEIEEWSKTSKWLGLNILKVFPLESDQAGNAHNFITFSAHYESADGKTHEHSEKSLFKMENKEWKFFDSEQGMAGTYRRAEPKVGRNDPCTCGSGKKYKKCHGLN